MMGGGGGELSSSRCKTITELLCWCVDGVKSYFSNVRSFHLWRQQIWRLFQLVCLLNGRVEDEVSMTLFVLNTHSLSHFVFSIKTSLKFVVLLVSKRSFVFFCFSTN